MEGVVNIIFWIVVGLIWFISAIAKKRRFETKPPVIRDTSGKPAVGGAYQASEDELSRFLKMISGEEEVVPTVRPAMVEEAKPVHVEPEPQEPVEAPVEIEESEVTAEPEIKPPPQPEPVHVDPERVDEITIPGLPRLARMPALDRMNAADLQQGIVLSEILGPPRAMRPFSYPL